MAKSSQKGLGRGLGALFTEPENTFQADTPKTTLPIQKLEPNRNQPRQYFDEAALAELAASIEKNGIIQPVVVRPLESGYYQIIAGERRWRAARMAGLTEVPVVIREVTDQQAAELALIENLQRENLNPIEEAKGYQSLINEYHLSQEDTANSVGKSRPAIANALRLLNLPEEVLTLVENGQLAAGHARALLALDSQQKILDAAQQVIAQELSVRQTEALVKRLSKPQEEASAPNVLKVDYYRECANNLTKALGRSVTIKHGKKKGVFQLEYYGDEDLQQLVELFEAAAAQKH